MYMILVAHDVMNRNSKIVSKTRLTLKKPPGKLSRFSGSIDTGKGLKLSQTTMQVLSVSTPNRM